MRIHRRQPAHGLQAEITAEAASAEHKDHQGCVAKQVRPAAPGKDCFQGPSLSSVYRPHQLTDQRRSPSARFRVCSGREVAPVGDSVFVGRPIISVPRLVFGAASAFTRSPPLAQTLVTDAHTASMRLFSCACGHNHADRAASGCLSSGQYCVHKKARPKPGS